MRTRAAVWGLVLVVAAVGCGGGDGGSDLGGDELTLREMCSGIATALCDKTAECAPPGAAGCVESYVSACCPASVDCDQALVDDGAADRLDDCLAGFRALSCADLEHGVTPTGCH